MDASPIAPRSSNAGALGCIQLTVVRVRGGATSPSPRASARTSQRLTGFPQLDALLADFVAAVRAILADDFVAAYLQGSFALGSADEWSDVDFVVVVERPVEDLAPLDALHAALYARETRWAQHLEGSYLPRSLLRHVDPARTPLPFLDNGSSRLVLDPHCNTALVRWVLRGCGIVLAGPPPAELIDPVAPEDLRQEARTALADYTAWAAELDAMKSWEQPYVVLTLCRILRTIECADVTSKAAAGRWAAARLPAWAELIAAAVADRHDRWERALGPADPARARRTREFAVEVAKLAPG